MAEVKSFEQNIVGLIKGAYNGDSNVVIRVKSLDDTSYTKEGITYNTKGCLQDLLRLQYFGYYQSFEVLSKVKEDKGYYSIPVVLHGFNPEVTFTSKDGKEVNLFKSLLKVQQGKAEAELLLKEIQDKDALIAKLQAKLAKKA